jgi:WD40 repeat protein
LWLLALLIGLTGCGRTPPNFVERPPLKGHSSEVTSIAFAPDGKALASRDAKGIKVWDLESGKPTAEFPWKNSDFGSVVYSPDGLTIAFEGLANAAVWSLGAGETVPSLIPVPPLKLSNLKRGSGLAYSPDGKFLAMGGSHGEEDGSVTLWKLSTSGLKAVTGSELPSVKRPISHVAFSPDGRTIGSGSMDGKMILWDQATRKERLSINASRSYLAPVIFSPDGQFVASANELRYVTLWEVTTGRNVGTLKGHIKAILSLAFHPDGQTIVSGDSDGTLFVWDIPSRKMLTRLESKDRGKIWSLAFSPDGKILAGGSEDRLVHLWDLEEPAKTGK